MALKKEREKYHILGVTFTAKKKNKQNKKQPTKNKKQKNPHNYKSYPAIYMFIFSKG